MIMLTPSMESSYRGRIFNVSILVVARICRACFMQIPLYVNVIDVTVFTEVTANKSSVA